MDLSIPEDVVRVLIQEKLRDGRLPYDGVTRTLEWPKRSLATFGCPPEARRCVAWACRRSWNLIRGNEVLTSIRCQA